MALPNYRVRPLAAYSTSAYYETAEAMQAAAAQATVPVMMEHKGASGEFGHWPPWPVVLVPDLVPHRLAKPVAFTQKGVATHYAVTAEGYDVINGKAPVPHG